MIAGIKEILRRRMGLEASSIGEATVESAIRERMTQAGAPTPEEYLARLGESPAEVDELVEAVVVPETWFFRDGAPFAALARWTREEWLPAHSGAALRVLTIPCSTGEEPYSVAMALLGAGLAPERFTVDAVDISRRALARAQRAVYGQNSFRGQDLAFRDRYFTRAADGYVLAAEVRRPVRFENGNLLAADFRPGAGRFDVIFCRNLLIYFDRPTQARALQALAGMLAPDGLFFVGHAETNLAVAAGFATANYPMSFAFRPAAASARAVAPLVRAPGKTSASSGNRPRIMQIFADGKKPEAGSRPPMLPSLPPICENLRNLRTAPLDAARALADQGKLADAARLCEDCLRQNGASAAAWYLLGVVRDAAGDRPRAAECFAKTLYLEPDHQDALLQRALLAEQSGDAAAAASLRRRIARVQQRTAAR